MEPFASREFLRCDWCGVDCAGAELVDVYATVVVVVVVVVIVDDEGERLDLFAEGE